jgi:hypothetical protein
VALAADKRLAAWLRENIERDATRFGILHGVAAGSFPQEVPTERALDLP